MPGAIVITRMPKRASSRATGSVIATMPPFDAEYAACPIWPSKAETDAVLTMTPRSPLEVGSLALIIAEASRITLNVPVRFVWMTRLNASRGWVPPRPEHFFGEHDAGRVDDSPQRAELRGDVEPALDARLVGHVDEPRIAPRPRAHWRSGCPRASFRSAMTTRAPESASRRAVASPSPEAPPVTKKTLVWSCKD